MTLGGLKKNSFDRIKSLLLHYKLPLLPPPLPLDVIIDAMTLDKKAVQGRARFVIISEIGTSLAYNGSYCTFVEKSLIKQTLEWLYNDLRCH